MRHHRSGLAIRSLVSIAALAAGGCGTTGGDGEPNIQAMAATYRYLFANNVSALQGGAANYCIGVGVRSASDPPEALMTALAGVTPEVQPISSCRTAETSQVVNTSGQPSLIFALAQIRCNGSTDCLFDGGYQEGNLSASRGRYRARLVNGQWQVSPEGPQAVS
jgi:hypothetical protein